MVLPVSSSWIDQPPEELTLAFLTYPVALVLLFVVTRKAGVLLVFPVGALASIYILVTHLAGHGLD